MSEVINWIVGRFISGQVLFVGSALCWFGCLLRKFSRQRWTQAATRIVVIVGALLVVSSATPLPFWMYGIFFGVLLLTWLRLASRAARHDKFDYFTLVLLLAQALVMAGTETYHRRAPSLPLAEGSKLFVLGDSLSIGADPPGKSWPELLGDLAHLKVKNFAFGGATVETAYDEALRIDSDNALVILELGGNDLLGGKSIARFRMDLEKMLTRVCVGRRRVMMIELPLPPFYNRYGMVQRALARAHGVILVPKRYLAAVLTFPGATVDGLHLSNTGHELFARTLFELRNDKRSKTANE